MVTYVDYFSLQISSQDKTTAVIQRALQKHKLEEDSPCNYQLLQLLGDGQGKNRRILEDILGQL